MPGEIVGLDEGCDLGPEGVEIWVAEGLDGGLPGSSVHPLGWPERDTWQVLLARLTILKAADQHRRQHHHGPSLQSWQKREPSARPSAATGAAGRLDSRNRRPPGTAQRLRYQPRNQGDVRAVAALLEQLPASNHLLGDTACDSDASRQRLTKRDTVPASKPSPARKRPVPFDQQRGEARNAIERAFPSLKDRRRIATRYDTCARHFHAAIATTAIFVGWGRYRAPSRSP